MKFTNERVLNGEYGLNGLPMHDTADKSYRMGIEGSMDLKLSENFHYVTAISLSKNKINTPTFDNKTHILTPSFTFNNDLYYTDNNLKIGINNQYHSSMYADQENLYEIPDYLTFNLYGSYRYKKFEFGARLNNLFNRTNYFNMALGANNQKLWFRNGGRNVFVDVKYYF